MNDGGEMVKPLGGFTWLEFLQCASVRVSPPPANIFFATGGLFETRLALHSFPLLTFTVISP